MKNLKIAVLLFVLFNSFVLAQSISFSSPTNGNTYTSTGNSSSVGIYFSYGYSYTPSPIVVISNYVKLILDGSQTYSTQGSSIPNYFEVTPGSHTWRLEYWEMHLGESGYTMRASQEVTFTAKFTIYATNNFSGGEIILEGNQVNVNGTNNKVYKLPNESVSVSSIEQSKDGYWMKWNTNGTNLSNWQREFSPIFNATSSSLSYIVGASDNGVTLSSDMKKLCSLTFQSSNGSMYVAGGTYSSSATVGVVEQNSITAYGNTYVVNGIEYRFTHWTKDAVSYGQTITPDAHGTYTANYDNGRPEYVNFYFGTVINDPIKVIWTDNPNTAVTYYNIYRREKINGVYTSPLLIGTVNRGVGYYNDADYTLAYAKNGTWLEYSVEAYYSTQGTYSDYGWLIAYGNVGASMQNNDLAAAKAVSEIPAEFAISNYPNPFNPATTINYQLPKDGMVTIKVYDILGKEVATLVNEQKSAGYYKVDFDASKMTSGVYIAAIQASSFNKSIKLLLTK